MKSRNFMAMFHFSILLNIPCTFLCACKEHYLRDNKKKLADISLWNIPYKEQREREQDEHIWALEMVAALCICSPLNSKEFCQFS
jgi:hypothetical protein